jgi:hypothetical protein
VKIKILEKHLINKRSKHKKQGKHGAVFIFLEKMRGALKTEDMQYTM